MKNVQRELNAMKESIATLNRKEDNELDEKENVLINLPLKTIDGDLRELEENLTNKEFRSQVIKELQQTGGKTIKNMSLQIMRKLFSDELAEQFSWVGGKKKEVFSDLRICKAILCESYFLLYYLINKYLHNYTNMHRFCLRIITV